MRGLRTSLPRAHEGRRTSRKRRRPAWPAAPPLVGLVGLGITLSGCDEAEEPTSQVLSCTPGLAYYCTGPAANDAEGRRQSFATCPGGAWVTGVCGPEGELEVVGSPGETDVELNCPGATCADAGASCPGLSDQVTCGPSNTLLLCDGDTWASQAACPGNGACTPKKDQWSCGLGEAHVDYAIAGRRCVREEDYACSTDQQQVLTCQLGVWAVSETCAGGVLQCNSFAAGTTRDRPDGTYVTCPAGGGRCIGCL